MTLKDLNFLLLKTEKIKKEIHSLKYEDKDVRHSFYCLFFTITYEYYLGQVSYTLSKLMANERVTFHKEDNDFGNHFNRITQIAKNKLMEMVFFGTLNRNVFLNTWTAFELATSNIFNSMCAENKRNKIIIDINNKIVRAIKDLTEENKEVVIKSLTKSTFIPLLRKFRYLIDKNKYNRNYKKDLEFLTFVNAYRNCMLHSNGIYYGKDFVYEFKEVKYHFINQEMFSEMNYYPYVYWDMAFEIKNIFGSLLNCINHQELIEYKSKL
ncbi:hypothetical protein ACIGCP_11900 [Cellulophaga baltica]|uniref:hypothetical protein n=1 Tax=Cellulophaga baltica TaxID=76594 RepID=UPI0037C99D08